MAIDPYEPELAKRKTAFQIAHKQLVWVEKLCDRITELPYCAESVALV